MNPNPGKSVKSVGCRVPSAECSPPLATRPPTPDTRSVKSVSRPPLYTLLVEVVG